MSLGNVITNIVAQAIAIFAVTEFLIGHYEQFSFSKSIIKRLYNERKTSNQNGEEDESYEECKNY